MFDKTKLHLNQFIVALTTFTCTGVMVFLTILAPG